MRHQARKRFGQNFLHDLTVIDQIIESIQAQPGQHWVEIGPGRGALTGPLLKSGVQLDVVELDRDLVTLLNKQYQNNNQIRIHSADALKFDFTELAEVGNRLHLIGNLPYNISTPLMFYLLESATQIAEMYFMLQKEVVDRICAQPGSKKYGRLSVMMQYYCQVEHLFDVPPESFSPKPKVMSAIFKLTPHSEPPFSVENINDLNKLVIQAFSQRRKTIRNSLSKLMDESDITKLGIDSNLRAESLSLENFIQLSNQLSRQGNQLIK